MDLWGSSSIWKGQGIRVKPNPEQSRFLFVPEPAIGPGTIYFKEPEPEQESIKNYPEPDYFKHPESVFEPGSTIFLLNPELHPEQKKNTWFKSLVNYEVYLKGKNLE